MTVIVFDPDDGAAKLAGKITAVSVTDDDPDVTTYTITAEAFGE